MNMEKGKGKVKIRLFIAGLMLTFFTVFSSGCASMLKCTVNIVSPALPEIVHASMAGINTCYGQGQHGAPGFIVVAGMLAEISPKNYTVNWTASQVFVATAAYNEMYNADYASDLAWQGYRFGLRSLKTNRKFRKAIESGMPVEKAVDLLPKKYIEGLTWTGMSLAFWMMMNLDDIMTITYMPQANSMLKRAVELDGAYFFGMPYAIDAAFSAMASEMVAECGLKRARASYKNMRDVSEGKNLMGDALYAQIYAVLIRDRALYRKLLQDVIDAPDDILEYHGFYITTLAKGRAEWLLANEDMVFENMGLVR